MLENEKVVLRFIGVPDAIDDEQHRCMGLNSHGVSKVSVIDTAGVKQVEHK